MRFTVELLLNENTIPKDKNRMILSLLKSVIESYDEEIYRDMYIENKTKRKNMTFSIYMKNAKFLRDTIEILDKRIILNISSSDLELAITIYNSFMLSKNKEIKLKDGLIIIPTKIQMKKKEIISDNYILVRTLSPICIRDHNGNNKDTWYYSLDETKGEEIFLRNLRYQLLEEFGETRKIDIDNLRFEVLENKNIKIKYYDIVIPSNKAILKLSGKTYLLEYMLDSGILNLKSSGFGMLERL